MRHRVIISCPFYMKTALWPLQVSTELASSLFSIHSPPCALFEAFGKTMKLRQHRFSFLGIYLSRRLKQDSRLAKNTCSLCQLAAAFRFLSFFDEYEKVCHSFSLRQVSCKLGGVVGTIPYNGTSIGALVIIRRLWEFY